MLLIELRQAGRAVVRYQRESAVNALRPLRLAVFALKSLCVVRVFRG